MSERFRPLGLARNTLAAAALIPAGALFSVEGRQAEPDFPVQQAKVERVDESLMAQLDDFVETDYGKVLAASVFALALASAAYNLQTKYETDDKNKYALSAATSGLFLAISASILYQTQGEVDPRLTASLIEGYALSQGLYTSIDATQRHKELRKRLPSYAASAAMVVASSSLLAETFK